MVTSQTGAAAAAPANSGSRRSGSSPRRALLRRVEPDPEVGVHALLAGTHLEQRVAQVAGPFGEQAGPLPDDSALGRRRALDRAYDPGDVDPDVLLPGDVESGDPDLLEVLAQRLALRRQHLPQDAEVRQRELLGRRFLAPAALGGLRHRR